MNERQLLVELLRKARYGSNKRTLGQYFPDSCLERIADHLLANGVTGAKDTNVPSKWIPASEPPKESGEYNVMIKGGVVATSLFYSKLENGWYEFNDDDCVEPQPVTHWQPMPTPPKEER